MRLRTSAVCAAGLVSLAFPGAAGGQQDVPPDVALVADPTPIASYGGRLVFSRADGRGRFELVQRRGDGPVAPVGVPSRDVPFDVDVGPTPGGRVLAVYPRCETEPPANRGEPSITEYQ